jgi:uncharacterized protein YkwD
MTNLSLISSVLSVLAIVTGLTVIAQAAISPESISLPNGAYKNLVTASSLEQSVHNQINQYRQKQNFPPLAFDEVIADQARLHSEEMANVGKISHDGFKSRAAALGKSIEYDGVAENVASNHGYPDPGLIAIKSWISSSTHHRTMVGNFHLTGIGIVEKGGSYYFTQIFVRKR